MRYAGSFGALSSVALALGCAAEPAVVPPCAVSELTAEVAVSGVDRLDVLFVIDNSPAMAPHRALLDQELPRMIEALVTGDFDPNDGHDASSLVDLHLGFVSTDMGDAVPDGDATDCSARGDEGALRPGAECSEQQDAFVWHFHHYHDDEASIATALCNAALEPGCRVVQPLEAALSALTRDDSEGFLRSDPGRSLIVIVFITAQDDCSLVSPRSARPSPAECAMQPGATQAVERYIEGLRALRPGDESLVRTLTIAGIPQDLLVTAEGQLRDPDWDYPATDAILEDPRMQLRVAADGSSLEPACAHGEASAAPARRLVELAGSVNPHRPQMLHSICAEGWTAALRRVVEYSWYSRSFGAACLPREVARDYTGLTGCRVYWTLPEWSDPAQPLTPAHCEDRPFLRDAGTTVAHDGSLRSVCEVREVSVAHDADGMHRGSGDGFYVDDGSVEALQSCSHAGPLLAFTDAARVPHGVTVRLSCLDETQRYRAPDAASDTPSIGDLCHVRPLSRNGPLVEGDAHCRSADDPRLFCDPWSNVCVRGCFADTDCPPQWTCDQQRAGGPDAAPGGTCVNPSCQALTVAEVPP